MTVTQVPDEVLVERICGRLIHLASGRSYHVKFAPPKVCKRLWSPRWSPPDKHFVVTVAQVPMTDDVTGEPLMKRKDDNEATLRNRLKAFHDQTKPVVDYYAKQGLYSPIDANQKSETVKGVISAILAK